MTYTFQLFSGKELFVLQATCCCKVGLTNRCSGTGVSGRALSASAWCRQSLSPDTGNLTLTHTEVMTLSGSSCQDEGVCNSRCIHLAFTIKTHLWLLCQAQHNQMSIFSLKRIFYFEVYHGSLGFGSQGDEHCLATQRHFSYFLTSQ